MRSTRPLWLLVAVGVLASCGTAAGTANEPSRSSASTDATVPTTDTAPGAGCADPPEVEPGTSTRTIDVGGAPRTYLLHVPTQADGTTALPLVVTLHGLASTSERQTAYSRWADLGDDEGVVVAAPQALGRPALWGFARPADDPASDVSFIEAMVDDVASVICVDPGRVFANGISAGSAMTLALACSGTETFAAFGGVSLAIRPPGCAPAGPVPLRYFHGTADALVPIEGGTALVGRVRPMAEVIAEWAAANGCDADPSVAPVSEHVARSTWSGCDGNGDIVVDVIDGGGHTWPGSTQFAESTKAFGATTDEVDATAEMWAFFEAHG